MSLSSTSLFHYTRGGLEALTGILRTGFQVKYSPEIHPETMAIFPNSDGLGIVISNGLVTNSNEWGQTKYLHIPMVCFCDIRFSNVSDHVKKYSLQSNGTSKVYAIGLTKAWGRRNGLNPIQYLVAGGGFVDDLRLAQTPTQVNLRIGQGSQTETELYCPPVAMGRGFIIRDNQGNTFPKSYIYSKVIQASYRLPDGKLFTANFQDEKEWRYVPEEASIIAGEVNNRHSLNTMWWRSIEINTQNAIKDSMPQPNLVFGANDIAHIIVDEEADILAIHNILKERFADIGEQQLALLLSKVNSYDSLFADI